MYRIYILGMVCGSCATATPAPANAASTVFVHCVALCWQIQHKQGNKEIKQHYIVDTRYNAGTCALFGFVTFIA